MITRHLAAGLCVLVIGAATLVAAPPSAPDPASTPDHPGTQVAASQPDVPKASASARGGVDVQARDHLSRPEQLALTDPSWQRFQPVTDF